MRDVYGTLSRPTKANKSFHARLNKLSEMSLDQQLASDLKWRAEHLGQTLGFWELVDSDIPYHLTQLSTLETAAGPMDGPKPLNAQHVTQTLWNHPFYKSTQLVRNRLRCFHRGDGEFSTFGGLYTCLLTINRRSSHNVRFIWSRFSRQRPEDISELLEKEKRGQRRSLCNRIYV
jgi:hypothetical protein